MLERLSKSLRGTLDKIARMGVVDKDVVEEIVRDIQRSLLAVDVNVDLVLKLTEKIKERALKEKLPKGLTRREHLIKVVYEEITEFLGKEKAKVSLKKQKILLIGLFGSGKTSTAAKLARFYQKNGLKPGLICCDVVRPAALDQLRQLARKISVPIYGEKGAKDSSSVLKAGITEMKGRDVVIVDSSGRDALDEKLTEEIKKLNKILKPDERYLVIPADIGQAAKKQSEEFHKAVGITGVIVTKLDSTAKGGGALTACEATAAKVKFIGVGEKLDDLEIYDPKRFVSKMLGFGDLEGLLEKAKSIDVSSAERMVTGEFTLEDFAKQMESVKSMGPMKQVLDMIPGMGKLAEKLPEGSLEDQEAKMKKWVSIVKSMTPEEKQNPDVLNHSRIERIAKGSGAKSSEVRELIKYYNQSKKLMKQATPGKLKRSQLGKLLKQFGLK